MMRVKPLNPKAMECQINEIPKRHPKNLEVQSSGEIRCKGIRTSEAPKIRSSGASKFRICTVQESTNSTFGRNKV
jgi:hypothetical protein